MIGVHYFVRASDRPGSAAYHKRPYERVSYPERFSSALYLQLPDGKGQMATCYFLLDEEAIAIIICPLA
jgi:hypothetical protein